MILEEFDLEKYLKLEKKESYAEGLATGRMEGHIEGQKTFAVLTQRLLADSRIDDLKKAAESPEYLEILLKEYNIN